MAKKIGITIISVIAVAVMAIFIVGAVKGTNPIQTLNNIIGNVAKDQGLNDGTKGGNWDNIIAVGSGNNQ